VPFGGKFNTLGTNPHSWGFPTTEAVGYPIVIDWATSVVAMGRVQQLKREGKQIPTLAAVDKDGNPTTNPAEAVSPLQFGAHKGYGLSLMNEIVGSFIDSSLPTIRNRWDQVGAGDKGTCCFFFQVLHPDAINGGAFTKGRNQKQNVKAVIDDVLGHGKDKSMLPGQLEAGWAQRTAAAGGLLFGQAEVEAFNELAAEAGQPRWNLTALKRSASKPGFSPA
jgi:LDH2 family malate/lactate/ureidoglycolate dehydrogenase